jgi:hypothetical protein
MGERQVTALGQFDVHVTRAAGTESWSPTRIKNLSLKRGIMTEPSGRAVSGEGLRPFAYCDCVFESRRGHGCLFLLNVVCCQVEVFAKG